MLLEGLRITAIAMAWVFAGLGIIWVLILVLDRVFPHRVKAPAHEAEPRGCEETPASTEMLPNDPLTAERARVAAIVAGALLGGALPVHLEAPVGSVFEHGRTAPNWVTANRARTLQVWQPPRHQGD